MSIILPIADTLNNLEFRKYIGRLVDGNLFHQRFETPSFIVNMMVDHSVILADGQYQASPENALIALTHKATGRFSLDDFRNKAYRLDLKTLMNGLTEGRDSALINSGLPLLDRLCEGFSEKCVGDMYRRQEAIPEKEATTALSRFFTPLSEAFEHPEVGEELKARWNQLSDKQKAIASKGMLQEPTSPIGSLSDFNIAYSLTLKDHHSMFVLDPLSGENDIFDNSPSEHRRPSLRAKEPFNINEIVKEIDDKRRDKIQDVMRHVRQEALEISSLLNKPDEVSASEVRHHIKEMYPIIEFACHKKSEWWSNFFGQSYTTTRNRVQLLEGPLHNNAFALDCLIKDETINNAIDNGTSLRAAIKDLPLFNTSKKTLNSFLNNLSAATASDGIGSSIMHAERGGIERDRLGSVHSFSLSGKKDKRGFLEAVAVIQSIPGKYYNEDEEHLARAMNMPFARHSLTTSINRVREGEWTPQQAFSWMEKLGDPDESHRIENQIYDTDRILGQFYLDTIAAHVMYQSGISIETIDDIRDQDPIETGPIMKTLASTQPYKNMINLSTNLHRRSQELMKVGAPGASVGWNRAIEHDYVKDDLVITPINSTLEMVKEGMVLNHCVGTYIKKAMQGETFIFGVRDAQGKRLSTFEVVEDDEEKYKVLQHFSHSNSIPSDYEKEVVSQFVEKIKDDEIMFDPETQVSENDLSKLTPIDRSEIELGLRYSDQEVAFEAVRHVSEMIPSLNLFQYLKDELGAYQEFKDPTHIHKGIEAFSQQYHDRMSECSPA